MNAYKVVVALLTCAAAAQAQTQTGSQTPAVSPTRPALLSETAESETDSPAVLAAKRALARRRAGIAPKAVITQETLAKSTAVLTTGSGAPAIPQVPTSAAPAPPTDAAPPKRASSAAQGGYGPPAYESCEPKPAQNTSPLRVAANSASAATAPPTATNSSLPPQPATAAPATVPVAANSSDGPRPSQNAGPYRTPTP